MLQVQLLTAAVAAITFIQASQAASTSAEDKITFASFEAEMQEGGGYQWQSFPVTSGSGYELRLFRIVGDEVGQDLIDTRGPVMLMHGSFSDSLDWVGCTDPTMPSVAVQLAKRGHDVWITSGRGREFSSGHTTLSSTDPLTSAQYWDYSFEEIGTDDIPAFVDAIIAARVGSCNKVTLIPHSDSVNASLIAASRTTGLSNTVGGITGMGPCIQLDLDTLFLPFKDTASITAVYNFMEEQGITNMFGPNHLDLIEPMCSQPGLGENICNSFFKPNPAELDPFLKEQSLKAYKHMHANSVDTTFETYPGKELYDLSNLNGIQMNVLFGAEDDRCPEALNKPFFELLTNCQVSDIAGAANEDFCSDNSLSFMDMMDSYLPLLAVAVDDASICPAVPDPCHWNNGHGNDRCGNSGNGNGGNGNNGGNKDQESSKDKGGFASDDEDSDDGQAKSRSNTNWKNKSSGGRWSRLVTTSTSADSKTVAYENVVDYQMDKFANKIQGWKLNSVPQHSLSQDESSDDDDDQKSIQKRWGARRWGQGRRLDAKNDELDQ